MKKMILGVAAAAAACTLVAEDQSSANPARKQMVTEIQKEVAETGTFDKPIVWGFTSWGFMSGYQLYGNLVNSEPTIQGYSEFNINLPWDLGYVGAAAFMNNDLTGMRHQTLRRAFNEMDPICHWEKVFFFNEDKTWGLDYRTWFMWYIYPDTAIDTTWDWDHTFTLINPYVHPYITWVREYSQGANLIEFGLKRPTQVTDCFSVTPSANFVWREAQYNWCFPTAGFTQNAGSGIATMRLQVDCNYQFTSWFSVWAKVAYCCTLDPELRDIQEDCGPADYGKYGDFAWGGVGICLCF